MRTKRLVPLWMVLLLLFSLISPVLVWASGDDTDAPGSQQTETGSDTGDTGSAATEASEPVAAPSDPAGNDAAEPGTNETDDPSPAQPDPDPSGPDTEPGTDVPGDPSTGEPKPDPAGPAAEPGTDVPGAPSTDEPEPDPARLAAEPGTDGPGAPSTDEPKPDPAGHDAAQPGESDTDAPETDPGEGSLSDRGLSLSAMPTAGSPENGGMRNITTYTVTVADAENGTVTVDGDTWTEAAEGALITLGVVPSEGYVLETLAVINDSTMDILAVNDDQFTMPASSVTVYATFAAAVAKCGDSFYPSVGDAVPYARPGDTIVLVATELTPFLIDAGQSVVLDLNGNAVETSVSNSGTLTIRGPGTIRSTDEATVVNEGALTLAGGTIQNDASAMYCAVQNRSGSLTVAGGTVLGSTAVEITGGSLTVTGGTLQGVSKDIDPIGGTVAVSGGQFQHEPDPSWIAPGYEVAEVAGGWTVVRSQPVPYLWIDAGTFPDPALRDSLVDYAKYRFTEEIMGAQQDSGVYFLTEDQTAAVVGVELQDSQITDLSGLDRFPNLQEVVAYGLGITALDLTSLSSLTVCEAGDMAGLTAVALPPSLERLVITGTGVASLDVSGMSALTSLTCSNNALSSLVIGEGNGALQSVSCENNHLAELIVPATVPLTSFSGDGQTVTGQGQVQTAGNKSYALFFETILTDQASLSKITIPEGQPHVVSASASNGQVWFDEKPDALYYVFAVAEGHAMGVTVDLEFPEDQPLDLSDVGGRQQLSLSDQGWHWNGHELTAEQARIVADGCDQLQLSLFQAIPSDADQAVFAGNMGKVSSLTVEIDHDFVDPSAYASALPAFAFPAAGDGSSRTVAVDLSSDWPVTLQVDPGVKAQLSVLASYSDVAVNGNVDVLEIKKWYSPNGENPQAGAVRIDGSVNELRWKGDTFAADQSGNGSYAGWFDGSLTVTGSIEKGVEYGSVSYAIPGLSDVSFNLPVHRISKAAGGPSQVIVDGTLQDGHVTSEAAAPAIEDVLLRYRYADQPSDSETAFRWAVSIRVPGETNDESHILELERMLPMDFSEDSIYYGGNTTVVVEGPKSSPFIYIPEAFGKERIVLNGDLARLEVLAAPVTLNGVAEVVRLYDDGTTFAGSSDVVLNGAVGKLILEGCQPKTNLSTGESGSLREGQFVKTQRVRSDSGSVSTEVLFERYFGGAQANQVILHNGALKLMSRSAQERWAAIMADPDDMAAAAQLSDSQYAVMTIQNDTDDLSAAESALVAGEAAGATTVSSFDVSISAYTTDAEGQVTKAEQTTDLHGNAVTFYLETPINDPDATYRAVRLHGDTAAVVGEAAGTAGRIQVASDRFSKYVVVKVAGKSPIKIGYATVYFEGLIRLAFAFQTNTLPAGGTVRLTKTGRETTVASCAVSEGTPKGEMTEFYLPVMIPEFADDVAVEVLDGAGNALSLQNASGTNLDTALHYSVKTYAENKMANGSTDKARALARALYDYGTAAQIYFKYGEYQGLTVDSRVTSVTEEDLLGYALSATPGTDRPEGVTANIRVYFHMDNKLRITYMGMDAGKSYTYTLDGEAITPSGGALDVPNIAAPNLDVPHTFVLSDGEGTFTVTASALSYALTSIQNGTPDRQNLGKALYLYCLAAKSYFE